MKFHLLAVCLGFSLCLPLTWAQTQGFTQSTPIAISGDGLAGEKGEDEATMQAREELKRSRIQKVKSLDEREEEKEVRDQQPQAPKQKTKPHEIRQTSTSWDWTRNVGFEEHPSFIEFSWGTMLSSWSEVDSELEDDSWVTGFHWGRFFHSKLSSSIGIEFVHPQEQQFVAEEVRLFQLSATLKHHSRSSQNFSIVSGTSLLIADWNVRKKVSTLNSQEVYQSFGSGSGVGIRPEFSLRWFMSESTQLDLKASWTQYLGTPENDFGGAGLSFQLHIQP